MILAEELTNEVLKDEYFLNIFQKAERIVAFKLFKVDSSESISNKEYIDLMKFADILSHSTQPDARNKSYKIISLLVETFKNEPSFKLYAEAILSKLGNFPALKFLNVQNKQIESLPLEREVEKRLKSEIQKTSNGEYIFTDAQFQVRKDLEYFDYFSFSGPTSIGKSFILKDYIRYLIHKNGPSAEYVMVLLVPTRALISQVVSDLRIEINSKSINIASHPVLTTYALRKYKHHIFVFTPERLLSYVSANNPSIKYLFVDEAQKVIAENDPRSSLYYHSIYETSRRFATKIIFASPNIPNPDIFLKLFEKDDRGFLAVREQTVSQNRYFIDCYKKRFSLFSELGEEIEITNVQLSTDVNELVQGIGKSVSNLIYCNGISETVNRAKDFANHLENIASKNIEEVIEFVSNYVHKDYYLIECLKKGVAFHHGKMPQRIRRKIEDLFTMKESPLRYIFCTSTLLEGVNLPAKNIFIFNDNHGMHVFEKIDFENLIGRAGRLTKEFSGNVICIKDNESRWKDAGGLLNKADLNKIDSFIVNKQRNRKKEFLNIGKSLANESLSTALKMGEQENITHYASIVLLHHIENEGSILKAGFLEKNKKAFDILSKAKKANKVPSAILRLSSTIRPIYQNKVLSYIERNQASAVLNINTESNDVIVSALEVLYDLYNWAEEEATGRDYLIPPGLVKSGHGKSRLGYWAMLLRNWTKSEPLSRLISFSINYHYGKGYIWYKENGIPTKETFIGNQKQINIIIEQIMNDIENGLRFKIEKYFRNYYLLLKHVLGEDIAGHDWSEYIEYGTIDNRIIELQRLGFSRGASKQLLEQHTKAFSFNESCQLLKINEDILLSNFDKENEYYEEIIQIIG